MILLSMPRETIVKVDLANKLQRLDRVALLATGDELANRLGAEVYHNGQPVDLSGYTVEGEFVRTGTDTIKLNGTIEGNKAYVDLIENCYYYDGTYTLTVKLCKNGFKQSLVIFAGLIESTMTDNIVTGEHITAIQDMASKAELQAMLAAHEQLKPEFAQTVEDCTDTEKLYVLPDGRIFAYMYAEDVPYTNHLPNAKELPTDSTPYNGIGYKPNTRLSISGGVFEERTETGWCASGLIKATYGDVIGLKNCVFTKSNPAGGSHRGLVAGADASGAFISGATSSMGDITADGSGWLPVYAEDGDNVIQFTVPSNLKNAEYIRIVVQEFNANSVITVNEEITEGTKKYAWKHTGHYFIPADYEPWLRDLEERTLHNTDSINALFYRVSELESNEDVKLPDYWKTHADEQIAEIRNALVNAGRNKSAFLWYHDIHWTYNYQQSPALLKYLSDNTVIKKTFFGGDVLDTENGLDLDTLAYVYDWRKAIRELPYHYSVVGNHDDGNSTETDGNIPEGFIYSMLMAAEEKPHVVYGDGYYYYMDEPAEKTRYIFCDTATRNGNIANDAKQTLFVKEALLTTPLNWHIICVAHIWQDMDYSVSPAVPKGFSSGAQVLLNMFDKYNNRMDDYSACGGKVEFCIGGHTHIDNNFYYESGYLNMPPIPVILTETDSRGVRGNYTATSGTTGENSVNAIVADYANKKVNIIRIGRGESRTAELY